MAYPLEKLENITHRMPGEKHFPLRTSKFPFAHPGNYLGPGTKSLKRIKRGDKPINFADTEAQAHDIRYGLSNNDFNKIKAADSKMVSVLKQGIKEKADYPFNLQLGLRGIQAKELIDKVQGKSLVNTGPTYKGEDRNILEDKLNELEKRGFGTRKANPWIAHVKAVAAKQGISYKEALKVAGASYKK